MIAGLVEFQDSFERLVAVPSLAEAEGRVVKQRFEDRLKQAAQDLLPHTIADRGDAPNKLHSIARPIWDGRL